jgi:hypothetical protein
MRGLISETDRLLRELDGTPGVLGSSRLCD